MKKEFLLTGAEMASCDVRTSEVIGIPSLVLMERAALSVADGVDVFLRGKYGHDRVGCRPVILAAAGRGNNGADALAAGRILLDQGYDVRFVRLSGKISPESSFAVQERILSNYGAEVEEFPASFFASAMADGEPEKTCKSAIPDGESEETCKSAIPDGESEETCKSAIPDGKSEETCKSAGGQRPVIPDVIIDGLFGTGLSRNLAGEAAEYVEVINRCRQSFGTYVIAVDLPSGISSDDGRVMGCAVQCDETRTFAFYKRGHFMYPGRSLAGALHLAQIGITERGFEKRPEMFTLLDARASDLLPARDPGGNKGTFGKVLIAAGRRNMCGAAILAAHACMASGAGMVKVFTHEANRLILQQVLPEALLDTFSEEDTPEQAAGRLASSLEWADVVAAGPAMGTDETGAAILRRILEYVQEEKKVRGLVLDADAIRLLSGDRSLRELLAERPAGLPCVLTPHMAEFAALAGRSVKECASDRTVLVQEEADLLRCVIACKDARTLIAQPGGSGTGSQGRGMQYLNCTGNCGMSAAGSGDVLTGITAAFLALDFEKKPADALSMSAKSEEGTLFTKEECQNGFAAAVSAVCLHGTAGDLAKQAYGEEGMTARDLVGAFRNASFWQR